MGALLLVLVAGSAHAGIPIKVVDTEIALPSPPDIAFSSSDENIIAYRHPGQNVLKLAYVTCNSIVYETLYDEGTPGFLPSLAISTLGFPSVVHRTTSDGFGSDGLRYTLDGGGLLGLQTIAIPGAEDGQMAVYAMDTVDRPYVAFRQANNRPGFAHFDIQSGQWVVQTLSTSTLGAAGRYIAVEVNHQDQPVVAYYDSNEDVVIATLGSGGWTTRRHAVGSLPDSGNLSLVLDSVDAPYVAICSSTELAVLRFNLLNVTAQTVVTESNTRLAPHAMGIDSANRLRIAFYQMNDHSLYLASNDFGWTTTLIQSGLTYDPAASLAIDSQSRWSVAYYDKTAQQIRVAGLDVAPSVRADFDCDGDVDADDLTHLESCTTGPAITQFTAACLNADLDDDNDIDMSDFAIFQLCLSGSGVPADPSCAE